MTQSKKISLSLKGALKFYIILYLLLLFFNCLAIFVEYGLNIDHDYKKGFVKLFDFDAEENVPTLFSVLLILQASVICIVVGFQVLKDQNYWFVLAFFLSFIALDEYVSIHERLIGPVRSALSTSGFFYYAWIIPYGIVGLIVGAFFLGWLLRLPKSTRIGFIKSGLIYFTGAFLIEGIGGWYYSYYLERNVIYSLITTVEESFEMIGLLTFLYFVTKFLITEVGIKQVELAG